MDAQPVPQKPFEEAIEKLLNRLRRAELPPHVFNLYRDDDPGLDLRGGAARRRENLRRYLKALREPAFVLVGLAPGYRGARFTGVPFSDEHRLCFPGSCYDRTAQRKQPWREASAGVVMETLGAGANVACFNVVPWHPHRPGEPLTNAEPDAATVEAGMQVLQYFFERLYPNARVAAVGKVAASALERLRVQGRPVPVVAHLRHPAHGGAAEFRRQAHELLGLPTDEE